MTAIPEDATKEQLFTRITLQQLCGVVIVVVVSVHSQMLNLIISISIYYRYCNAIHVILVTD